MFASILKFCSNCVPPKTSFDAHEMIIKHSHGRVDDDVESLRSASEQESDVLVVGELPRPSQKSEPDRAAGVSLPHEILYKPPSVNVWKTPEQPAPRKLSKDMGTTFDAILDMSEGQKLGLAILKAREDRALEVKQLQGAGAALDWNTANPDKQIKEDHIILSIGGVTGDADLMIAACMQAPVLKMKRLLLKIQRP